MAVQSLKVTWVLGTGFSVPLGGPMLKNLLSTGSHAETLATYPDLASLGDGDAHNTVYLFNRYKPETGTDAPAWEDAEEFLDYVDTATHGDTRPGRKRLAALVKGHWGDAGAASLTAEVIQVNARRLVAAQCCAFLKHADTDREAWQPYVRWANELLRAGDTVITFNYDCVIEKLNAYRRSSGLGDYASILDTDDVSDALWTRISAVVSVETVFRGLKNERDQYWIDHAILVVHNPFADKPLDSKLFAEHPQFVCTGDDEMRWTDGYDHSAPPPPRPFAKRSPSAALASIRFRWSTLASS